MRELEDVAAAFGRACTDGGVPYAFIGGIAVMAWGQPRATVDAQVLRHYQETDIPQLVDGLDAEDLHVQAYDLEVALEDGSHVTVFDDGAPYDLDVKPALHSREVEEVESAVLLTIEDQRFSVVRPEETIAYKLLFGSEQDLKDARSILVRQKGALDRDRLADRVKRLGVSDELETILAGLRATGIDPGG